jgi:hypothetical protein
MNESRRKGFELRGWHVIVGILAVLMVLFVLFRVFNHSALERKIAELRAKGYPTTFEELEKYNQLPEGTPNAAEIYLKAFELHQRMTDEEFVILPYGGRGTLPDAGKPFVPEMKAAMESYLARNQNTLDHLHQAAQIGECQYPIDASIARGERLNKTKQTAQLLCLAALIESTTNSGQSTEKVMDLIYLGRSLHRGTQLLDHLVKNAIYSLSPDLLKELLSRTRFSSEDLQRLAMAFRMIEANQSIEWGYKGEICEVIGCLDYPRQFWSMAVPGGSLMRMTGIIDRNYVVAIELLMDCIEASKLPLGERFKKLNAIEQRWNDLSFLFAPLKQYLLQLENLAENDARLWVRLGSATAALAIEKHRLAEGRLPETLEELVPKYLEAVPMDPFDGKPLRYKRLEKGYTIFSVGEDGEDNGGVPKDKVEKGANYDWPFTVERE